MSRLGQNVIPVPDLSEGAKDPCKKVGDAVDNAVNTVTEGAEDIGNAVSNTAQDVGKGIGNAVSSIFRRDPASAGDLLESACNEGAKAVEDLMQIATDAVEKFLGSIAKALGIKEYYSVHFGALCEGEYDKTFNKEGAKPVVQKCTPKFSTNETDLSKTLDLELGDGPVSLAKIDLVQDIKNAFDLIPRILATVAYLFLFIVLVLCSGFLWIVAMVVCDFKEYHNPRRIALFAAIGCIGLGWFLTLIGAAVTTGVAEEIKKAVNKHGEPFGVSANTSPALWFLLWGAVVCSTVTLSLLIVSWLKMRRDGGLGGVGSQGNAEKNKSTASNEGQQPGGGYYDATVTPQG
jgi:hypothetical protein